jgi:hypothetical protein
MMMPTCEQSANYVEEQSNACKQLEKGCLVATLKKWGQIGE